MSTRFIEIKKWLIDRGLTQAEIARKVGVSPITIHNFVKGFTTSRRIEAAFRDLGCPDDLLERKVA